MQSNGRDQGLKVEHIRSTMCSDQGQGFKIKSIRSTLCSDQVQGLKIESKRSTSNVLRIGCHYDLHKSKSR